MTTSKQEKARELIFDLLCSKGGNRDGSAVVFESHDPRFKCVLVPFLWVKSGLRLMFSTGINSFRHQLVADVITRGLPLTGYFRPGEEGRLWFRSFFAGGPLGIVLGRKSESGIVVTGNWTEARAEIEGACLDAFKNGLPAMKSLCDDQFLVQLAERSWMGPWDIAASVCHVLDGKYDEGLDYLTLGERNSTGLMPAAYPEARSRLEKLVRSGFISEVATLRAAGDELPKLISRGLSVAGVGPA